MKKTDVLEHFKSQNQAAEALGITHSSISQWGDIIPEKQALRLDRLTKGKLRYDPRLYKKTA